MKIIISIKAYWKHESQLYSLIKNNYDDAIREYSPNWLREQRIDIFIPSKNIAIEYQGEQHYKPVDYFGGEKAFIETQKRDKWKIDLCIKNNIKLLEWPYPLKISQESVKKFFEANS